MPIRNVSTGYMVRAPTGQAAYTHEPTTEYRCAAGMSAARGLTTAAVTKTGRRFFALFRAAAQTAERRFFMAFFNSAIGVLQTLVIALGAGLGIWGVINLLEGYGNDNPGAKSQGMKQLMAGGGVALIGATLVPLLSGLFG